MNLSRAAASRWLVVTDLDGTLLDHHSYSAAPAQPSLDRLRRAGIPVVLNSSKTRVELRQWMERLHLDGPLISENGACIEMPADWVDSWSGSGADHGTDSEPNDDRSSRLVRLSPCYSDIVATLHRVRDEHGFQFRGFADMSDQEVAELTGLSAEQAALARHRDGSEPLLWQGAEGLFNAFAAQLAGHGLKTLRGGRFWHVVGAQADKAYAVHRLVAFLKQHHWSGQTLALGDAPNDHAMLAAVDQPVLVANPAAAPMPAIDNPRLYRSRLPGPQGWREAIDRLIPKEHSDE